MGKIQKKTGTIPKATKNTGAVKRSAKKSTSCKQRRPNEEETETKDEVVKSQTRLAVNAVLKLDEKQSSKSLFEERTPIFLQIMCIKIPNCPTRTARLKLKHSLYKEADACLIVPDLKRGRKVDFEPTIEHYQNLLEEKGVGNIKRIIPINQLKTEYDQFELKRHLAGQYDVFLVDGKISGHVSHLLGKIFYSKRKLPIPVKLGAADLKKEINGALMKTCLPLHSTGDTFIVQVGHTRMEHLEIEENIDCALRSLQKEFPGGIRNVRAVHLKTHRSLSVPVFVSLKERNSVKVPKIKARRPKKAAEVRGELTTAVSDVIVLPSGAVHVIKNDGNK